MKKSAGNCLLHRMSLCSVILLAVFAVNTLIGAEIIIHMDKPSAAVSPTLYGAFLKTSTARRRRAIRRTGAEPLV
jgi:uncharacterized membrane protein